MAYTKAALARKLDLGRSAITNACARKKLFANSDGLIDVMDSRNKEFFSRLSGEKKAAVIGQERASRRSSGDGDEKKSLSPRASYSDLEDMSPEELSHEKIVAEISYKKEAAENLRIKRLEALGQLVEREQVKKVLSRFNAEQKVRLLELPRTLAPHLVSLVKSGAAEWEISQALEREISVAIVDAKRIALECGMS